MSNTAKEELGSNPMDIRNSIKTLQTALVNLCFSTAGLAIATTKTKVKIATAFKALIDGALVTKAITDNAYTLAGTVTNAKFNVFVLTLNAAGTCTPRMGTEGATLSAVLWPQLSAGEIVIGYVIVNPTGTGNFVGGTTDLDDATVVPNAVYVNTPYPFNPNVIALPSGYVEA